MGGTEGLDPEFMRRLLAMQAAARAEGVEIGWGSGTRSIEEQIALRKSNGCPDVWTSPASSCRVPTAIPGRSNHNHGLAMDITGDKAWANANAAQFGLHFPVEGEDWHVEMTDDEGSRGAMTAAQQRGAIGFDLGWTEAGGDPTARRDEMLQSYLDAITTAQEQALLGTPAADPMLGTVEPEMPTAPDMAVEGDPGLEAPEQLDATAMAPRPTGGGPVAAPSGGGGGDIKSMVKAMAAQMGWGEDQWPALERLVQKESSWNPTAQNPTSTAYGLFQFLDSTWANYGQKTSDPAAQAQAGLAYIRDRYGSPASALAFHDQNNWY
jgi:hypothetical protein